MSESTEATPMQKMLAGYFETSQLEKIQHLHAAKPETYWRLVEYVLDQGTDKSDMRLASGSAPREPDLTMDQ